MNPFHLIDAVDKIKFNPMLECSVCSSNGRFTDVNAMCPVHARAWEIEARKSSILADYNGLVKLLGESSAKNFINSIV